LALFPTSARLLLEDKEKMKRVYLKGLLILFLVSLPIVLGGFLFSPFLVSFLLGGQYLPFIPALKVAFLSLVFFFVNVLPGNVILNSRKIKGFIPLAFLNLVVNVSLNLLLIPRFSFVGSAWAKLGSEAFGFLINNLYVWRILRSDQ